MLYSNFKYKIIQNLDFLEDESFEEEEEEENGYGS